MRTPDHYDFVIQPVEYIMKNNIGFCEGNIIKYISRWRYKGGLDDLKKARHYIDILMADVIKRQQDEESNYEG